MKLAIIAEVVDARDSAALIVSFGGQQVAVSQAVLNAASTDDSQVIEAAEACIAQAHAEQELKASYVPPRRDEPLQAP